MYDFLSSSATETMYSKIYVRVDVKAKANFRKNKIKRRDG